MLIVAGLCAAAAVVAGGFAASGIAKGLVGLAKLLFFGFLAAAGVFTALGLFAAHRLQG